VLSALELSDVRLIDIPGKPHSKARPRFRHGSRAYADPKDRDAEKRTAAYLRLAMGGAQPYPSNVGLVAVFFRPSRQVVDADNLLKHLCDSANGILWYDDCQATAKFGVIELDRQTPRTVVAIGRYESSMPRAPRALKVAA
jgi:Holliday junction resolvase RusA-like endonuclease